MLRLRQRFFPLDTSGAVAIEMAAAVPIFVAFLIGFIGLSHAYWVYCAMEFAADHGGRYAMMHVTATHTDITDVVKNHLYGISANPLTVTITEQVSGGVTMQTIALSYQYNFINNIASFLPSSLSTSITVPLVP